MKPWIPLALLLTSLAPAHTAPAPDKGSSKPNFIFILTDDQGWADAKFAGHPCVRTPNLDRLAGQGTWFKQFYVAATVCSPSRCGFMTSHFPARHHIHGHFADHASNQARSMPDWLDPQTATVTRLLHDAGYATAHFGKWHLGSNAGAPSLTAYGIDVHRTAGGAPPTDPELGAETLPGASGERSVQKDPYFRAKSTAMIFDETIKFIKANRERPFYVNAWTFLPHAPLNPTPEQLKEYESIAPRADDPAFGPWMQKYLANAKDMKSQMQVFCASVTDIDTQVGRLMAALDELGLSGNTVVFFSSDNGPEDYRIRNASNGGVGSTGPLRARKRSMYEGGIRTFGLLRWPGHVAAGRVDETSVLGAVDWLPTVCKLAGVSVPGSAAPDGEDVSDIWLGQSRPRRRPLHWEWLFEVTGGGEYQPPRLAIRDGAWKLFIDPDGSHSELYDIPRDPSELSNVAGAHPDVVQDLTARALAWRKSLPPSEARDAAAVSTKQTAPAAAGKGTPATRAAVDRHAMFRSKDANHDGRLTIEEYLFKFSDEAMYQRRFTVYDTNKDGALTEEEFVNAGKPPSP